MLKFLIRTIIKLGELNDEGKNEKEEEEEREAEAVIKEPSQKELQIESLQQNYLNLIISYVCLDCQIDFERFSTPDLDPSKRNYCNLCLKKRRFQTSTLERTPEKSIRNQVGSQVSPGDTANEDNASPFFTKELTRIKLLPLKFYNIEQYFRQLSSLMFQEELQRALYEENARILESSDIQLNLLLKNSKNQEFEFSLPMIPLILNRLLSEKQQLLEFNLTSYNLSVFLMSAKNFWYGRVIKTRTKQDYNVKVVKVRVRMYNWCTRALPITTDAEGFRILFASPIVNREFKAMTKSYYSGDFVRMFLGNTPIPQVSPCERVEFVRDLNESQKASICAVLTNKFTIVQGPSGSGKTTIINELILQLIKSSINIPIAVVAASNNAVDNIAARIMKTNKNDCLRIVAWERESEYNLNHPLASICLHHKVIRDLSKELKVIYRKMNDPSIKVPVSKEDQRKLRREQRRISKIYIDRAKVLFSTTLMCGSPIYQDIEKIPVVIMDESTQSSEASTLIPISKDGVKKVVLVGDEKQLSGFSLVPDYSRSLFERMLYSKKCRNPFMLNEQYRMHPSISEFPSKHFYNGLLKDGITKGHRLMSGIPPNPVYFWDTCQSKPEKLVAMGATYSSYINQGEADYTIKVLENLISTKGVKHANVAIVTPYIMQRELLLLMLVENKVINPKNLAIKVGHVRDSSEESSREPSIKMINGIMVLSIDGFQGREVDFVVFSCVRSNEKGEIGVLSDRRRLNVALTRARYGLIIIGDSKCLKNKNTMWKEYMEHLESNGSVHCNEEFTY